MSRVVQKKTSDPTYKLHPGSIRVYRCPKCGREESDPLFLRCPADDTMMVPHSHIPESKVESIVNRTIDYSQPSLPEKQEDAWDLGLVQTYKQASVYPRQGSGKLQILGNKNKFMWENKIVEINGAYYSLYDIGKALAEFV